MGLSPNAKLCLAICAVGLAFIIPISILVVAPMIGQHALNVAVMNIPNSTVFDIPGDLHADNMAKIANNVNLKQTFFPLPSTLHETKFALHVPAASPDAIAAGVIPWPECDLAWFTLPEQAIKHGTNTFQFTADLTVLEPDYFVFWSLYMTFLQPPPHTIIQIVGQPTLSALGGIFRMGLQMGKTLNCSCIGTGVNDAEAIESLEAAQRVRVGIGPVTLECVDQGEMDGDLIDKVLQNFTRELDATTTTTTTPPTTTKASTPTPAPTPAPPPTTTTTATNGTTLTTTTTTANVTTPTPTMMTV